MSQVKLTDVRIAYAQGLFEARAPEGGGEPKYSAAFLFPKNHPVVAALSEAVVAAAKEKWKDKAMDVLAQLKAADRLPVHDGDLKKTSEGYAGNLYLNAGNKVRPLILGPDRSPLTAADGKPYSGCYVTAIVEIWAQDNKFGKRVNASLQGVQFIRDGERLAGGSVASVEDFEPVPSAAGNAAGAKPDASAIFG